MEAAAERDMTEAERSVLDSLLAIEFPGVQELRDQARTARVENVCACQCGSFDLTTDPTLPDAPVVSMLPSGGTKGDDDSTVDLMLWARGGRLGGVEVVYYFDHSADGVLPDPDDFEISPGAEDMAPVAQGSRKDTLLQRLLLSRKRAARKRQF